MVDTINPVTMREFEDTAIKQYDPISIQGSIVKTPPAEQRLGPRAPLVFQIAHKADEITPWGKGVRSRDAELRSFWPTEPILASAVFSMVSKLSVLNWEIVGSDPTKPKPRNTAMQAERLLQSAGGIGFQKTLIKLLTDVYTQDNGGFLEIIREKPTPDSAVIGIQHLDAARCWRTGDPEYPVYYQDMNGRYHKLAWYQVITFEDMPSPVEQMYGVQYCALTRILRYAQLLRDISIYKREKISGRNPGVIHFMSGITQNEIDDARAWAEENQLNQQLFRYAAPYIIGTINPNAKLDHKEIRMASLPDSYNENDTYKWYITIIALGFGTDYQEFAPLASANLGSSSQSEILHMKSRGKGPASIVKMVEDAFNFHGILPSTVHFRFKLQDTRNDKETSEAKFTRAKTISLYMDAGVLSPKQALELMKEDGDIPEYLLIQRLEELENQPAQPTKNPDPTTSDQITGGMETQGGAIGERGPILEGDAGGKSTRPDDVRVALIQELQRRGELLMPEEPVELTQEDIDKVSETKSILSRFNDRLNKLFGGE